MFIDSILTEIFTAAVSSVLTDGMQKLEIQCRQFTYSLSPHTTLPPAVELMTTGALLAVSVHSGTAGLNPGHRREQNFLYQHQASCIRAGVPLNSRICS